MWLLRQCYSPLSINNPQYHWIHFINKPFIFGTFEKSDNLHPFVLLYKNYTLHHSYKKTKKTDGEKASKLFENMKIKGCRHANLFKKNYISIKLQLFKIMKKDSLYLHPELRLPNFLIQLICFCFYIAAQIIRKQNPFSKIY